MKTEKFYVQIGNESGSVVLENHFTTELAAQNHFDFLETIKYPLTYKGLTMNLTEYYHAGVIGWVKLIVENGHGYFIRRELFRQV